ncbi:protein MULTIPLE CHLOROPLAST DIVISION SITE 1 [Morus notabilis]|uniref:protein MULTIPLE CHLOROPLAST DIVISION SITE 1 n=1 Tax=Morus notabilis TaxID=981085 RepID=UPI000CED3933|nr:protein MULTIPLE CHLOROPLAST DIVISION SITE 1 [Morus notabilis]
MASSSLCTIQPLIWTSSKLRMTTSYLVVLRPEFGLCNAPFKWIPPQSPTLKFVLRAVDASAISGSDRRAAQDDDTAKTETTIAATTVKDPHGKSQATVGVFPLVVFAMKRQEGSSFAIGIVIAATFFVLAVRIYLGRKARASRPPGSVADLVRRGQLRSDRRGITRPLKYDDPFNNPLVKVGKSNSTVEMCGKVYRLAPVTLTEEQQAIHQKRRSRAYQWKRPTVFLKEGDSIPPDVDPDTVRWIPANHPFATTASDIDEDLAQNNVRQKHGVPFRIQAEHEALQRKLEALQGEQKLNKLVIDSSNAKDFERAFKSHPKSPERGEESLLNEHVANSKAPLPEWPPNSSGSTLSSEERQKP